MTAEPVLNKPEDDPESTLFRAQFQKTIICKFNAGGRCRNGTSCSFAHSAEELRSAPDLTKTSLCEVFMKGEKCKAGSECPFAHGHRELRMTPMFQAKLKRKPVKGQSRNKGHAGLDCEIPPMPSGYKGSVPLELALGLQDSSKMSPPPKAQPKQQLCDSGLAQRMCLQNFANAQQTFLQATPDLDCASFEFLRQSTDPCDVNLSALGLHAFSRQVSDPLPYNSFSRQSTEQFSPPQSDCSDSTAVGNEMPVYQGKSAVDAETAYRSKHPPLGSPQNAKSTFVPVFVNGPCELTAMKDLASLLSNAMPDHYED